jgi:hypothetical protein
MNNEQSYEQNRTEFIARLLEAGWSKADAESEWLETATDDELGDIAQLLTTHNHEQETQETLLHPGSNHTGH